VTAKVQPKPPQLKSLTGLRGVAAWWVVLYHLRGELGGWLAAPLVAVCAKGYLAVDVFFMLSGFVIWLNYAGWFHEKGWRGTSRFFRKRFARIWPLHAAVLLTMVAMAGVLAVAGGSPFADHPWAELPLHFLLVQNWGFTSDTRWNVPAWSISTEFGAYLVFPLLVLIARPDRWRTWLVVAAIPALLVVLHLFFRLHGGVLLNFDVPHLGLGRCLIQFAIGTLICIIWQRTRGRGGICVIAVVLGLGAGALWVCGILPETLGFPLAVAPLLLALADWDNSRWNWLSWRPLEWLGEVSYSTYLIHFVGWTIFSQLVAPPGTVTLAKILVFLILVLIGSTISYRLIEKPGRAFFGKVRRKPADPATAW